MIAAVVLILGALAYALARSGWMVSAAVLGVVAAVVALFGLAESYSAGFFDSHHRPKE